MLSTPVAPLQKFPPPVPGTAACKLARDGDIDALRALLDDTAQLDAPDETGNSPLIYAADAGHANVCTFLLSQGNADVNRRGFLGNTAISRAARQGWEDVTRVLLDAPDLSTLDEPN